MSQQSKKYGGDTHKPKTGAENGVSECSRITTSNADLGMDTKGPNQMPTCPKGTVSTDRGTFKEG